MSESKTESKASRLRAYLQDHPNATIHEVREVLGKVSHSELSTNRRLVKRSTRKGAAERTTKREATKSKATKRSYNKTRSIELPQLVLVLNTARAVGGLDSLRSILEALDSLREDL